MVRKFVAAMVLVAAGAAAQPVAPTPGNAKTAENAPQMMTSFGGIRPHDTIAGGWTVSDIAFKQQDVFIRLLNAAKQHLTIGVSLEKGKPGAFDTDGVRIYYENAPLPQEAIVAAGKDIAARLAKFAAGQGGLRAYTGSAIAEARKENPEQNVSRETARKFLDQLAGDWDVTVLQWPKDNAAPKTIGRGTATRRSFLNSFIIREDATGAEGTQFLATGCSAESARCWLFILDNTSSGYQGGWGVFSETDNALKVVRGDSGDPLVVLRVIDHDRNVLEFYDAAQHPSLVRTMRYDRKK